MVQPVLHRENLVVLLLQLQILLLLVPKAAASKPNSSSVVVAFHNNFFPNTPPPPTPTTSTTQQPMVMRAWTCHGRNQRDLVDKLMLAKIVQTPIVRDALYQVDRKNYAGTDQTQTAYADAPQPLGLGQTISAPHMHAHVLEQMVSHLKQSKANELSILDVGSGSGYLTAALGRLVDPQHSLVGKPGKVYGMDVHRELIQMARNNIQKGDGDLLDRHVISVALGDGWKGLPDKSPFDAIHVGAAADEFPQNLMMQLRVGGVLVVPVGPQRSAQALYKVERLVEHDTFRMEDFQTTRLLDVRYVPLVHP